MPELRRGPIRGRWVIIAPERGKRPSDFRVSEEGRAASPDNCPFCPGNEHLTPPEIYRVKSPTGGWLVRVVPNKFPALGDYPELGRAGLGAFDRMNGVGAHEVVIETPDHDLGLADLPSEQVKLVVDTYVARLRELGADPRVRYVQLFKNHGARAGASLAHSHAQIVAIPVVPSEVEIRLQATWEHYERAERCLFCDILQQELGVGERVVEESEGYVVIAPYDSRFPFELLIMPRYHAHDFTAMDEKGRLGLADILRRTLRRLKALLGDVPYNFVLQNAPTRAPVGKPWWGEGLEYHYHWHLEIIPRLTQMAGFEWGTGFYINPMPPEEAARHLREQGD